MNSYSSRPVGPGAARRPRPSPGRSLSLSILNSVGRREAIVPYGLPARSFRAVAVAVVGPGGSGRELGIGVVWLP